MWHKYITQTVCLPKIAYAGIQKLFSIYTEILSIRSAMSDLAGNNIIRKVLSAYDNYFASVPLVEICNSNKGNTYAADTYSVKVQKQFIRGWTKNNSESHRPKNI